jgi:hypothetical protein
MRPLQGRQQELPPLKRHGNRRGCIRLHLQRHQSVAGDTNAQADIFIGDLATGTTERVSLPERQLATNYAGRDTSTRDYRVPSASPTRRTSAAVGGTRSFRDPPAI